MNEFQLQGINHIALVCKDMARTVDFYTNTLGLKLIKTIALPDGGQHFFFDIGNKEAIGRSPLPFGQSLFSGSHKHQKPLLV
jgi:catechol 2,3-dioxygenase-like lactoylglutathione lyase family enzyme